MKFISMLTFALVLSLLLACGGKQETINDMAQAEAKHLLKNQAFTALILYQGKNDTIPDKLSDLNDPALDRGLQKISTKYDIILIKLKDHAFHVVASSKSKETYSYAISSSGIIHQWSDKSTNPPTDASSYANTLDGKWVPVK